MLKKILKYFAYIIGTPVLLIIVWLVWPSSDETATKQAGIKQKAKVASKTEPPIEKIDCDYKFDTVSAKKGSDAYKKKDYVTALKEAEELANKGNVVGQTLLGILYATGRGVEKDEKKGFELTSKAASKCHARAEYNLATMFYHGIGVEANRKKANELFNRSADQGFSSAHSTLGLHTSKSSSGRNDEIKAEMHFKIAEMLGETQEEKTMFSGSRKMMTKYMKPDAVAEAHSLAKEYVSKTPKPADYLFNYYK